MRRLFTYLIISTLLLCSPILSQNNHSKILKDYRDYFELRGESIFIHLNKTKYISGETIFFKAYLFDQQTSIPLKESTNLYVGLYDYQGKQVQKSMWQVNNGMAIGNLNIDPAFNHGYYYLKAYTNWMKNFNENDNNLQKIEIIKYDFEHDNEINQKVNVRLVPEGGHLLSGVINTIGFQIQDRNDKGVAIKNAQVLDSLGNVVISNIKSNPYGIGKFDLVLKESTSYICRFELVNGQIIYNKIPDAEDQGYSINVTGAIDNRIITVRTNKKSLKGIKNNDYHLAIHRNGQLKLFSFKLNEYAKSFTSKSLDLIDGVNIISLLDHKYKLIAERLFYNPQSLETDQLEAEIVLSEHDKDSVRLRLKAVNIKDDTMNLSLSIMPHTSSINAKNISIYESVFLKPYLNVFAENVPYLLKNFNRETLYNLDLLFLIHGESDYSWNHNKDNNPIKKFERQNGITITGIVKNKKIEKTKSIVMYQNQIEQMHITEIKKDRSFSFKNATIIKNEPIFFMLLDHKGQMEKPEIDINFLPKMFEDSIVLTGKSIDKNQMQIEESEKLELKQILDQNRIDLDNVSVFAKPQEEGLNRNPKLSLGVWNGVKISEKLEVKHRSLSNYIRNLGFKVSTNPINGSLFVDARTAMNPFIQPPSIYLNGFRLFEPLRDFPLYLVDEIYYEHTGLMESNGGTIHIYRKEGRIDTNKTEAFISKVAEEGFGRPIKFVNQFDADNRNELFKKYACIYWEPHAIINSGKELEITFPRQGLNSFKIFIEGVSNDGIHFSTEKSIMLDQE